MPWVGGKAWQVLLAAAVASAAFVAAAGQPGGLPAGSAFLADLSRAAAAASARRMPGQHHAGSSSDSLSNYLLQGRSTFGHAAAGEQAPGPAGARTPKQPAGSGMAGLADWLHAELDRLAEAQLDELQGSHAHGGSQQHHDEAEAGGVHEAADASASAAAAAAAVSKADGSGGSLGDMLLRWLGVDMDTDMDMDSQMHLGGTGLGLGTEGAEPDGERMAPLHRALLDARPAADEPTAQAHGSGDTRAAGQAQKTMGQDTEPYDASRVSPGWEEGHDSLQQLPMPQRAGDVVAQMHAAMAGSVHDPTSTRMRMRAARRAITDPAMLASPTAGPGAGVGVGVGASGSKMPSHADRPSPVVGGEGGGAQDDSAADACLSAGGSCQAAGAHGQQPQQQAQRQTSARPWPTSTSAAAAARETSPTAGTRGLLSTQGDGEGVDGGAHGVAFQAAPPDGEHSGSSGQEGDVHMPRHGSEILATDGVEDDDDEADGDGAVAASSEDDDLHAAAGRHGTSAERGSGGSGEAAAAAGAAGGGDARSGAESAQASMPDPGSDYEELDSDVSDLGADQQQMTDPGLQKSECMWRMLHVPALGV